MSTLRNIKTIVLDACDWVSLRRAKRWEFEKFKDPRRVAIIKRRELSEEEMRAIDALYQTHYGRTIPYTWHRHYSWMSSNFDSALFPEFLYIPEFERFQNQDKSYTRVLADKNILPLIAESLSVRMPKSIVSCSNGNYCDSGSQAVRKGQVEKILFDAGLVFCKPSVDSSSGRNCFIANFHNGVDELSGCDVSEIIEQLGLNFVIQEKISCHESLASIYPHSVNTFRVITYRWRGDIYAMPVILRMGRGGSNLDNAHAGGLFIAVDDSGVLHQEAMTEFENGFRSHPDTGLVFHGHTVIGVPGVISAAKKMHAALGQIGVANWDFTVDETGEPVLIELNLAAGSIWLPQMAHGVGPFAERTGEVLEWLRFMESIPASKRGRYKFGLMPETEESRG